jgi:hypothetical protein
MKFTITKKVSLSEVLGKGHGADYIELRSLTYRDAKKLKDIDPDGDNVEDELLRIVKENFVGGLVTDNGEEIKITKDDIEDLPIDVFAHVIKSLSGGVSEGLKAE